jgi:hypothetical protein
MEQAFTIPFFQTGLNLFKKKTRADELDEEQFLLENRESFAFHEQPHVVIENRFLFDSEHKHLKYLPTIAFQSSDIFYDVIDAAKKAKEQDQIPAERIWMGIYFDLEFQQQIHPKVSIRFIDNQIGFGVFAQERIYSCAFVGEYTGVLTKKPGRIQPEQKHSFAYTIWNTKKRKFTLNAEKQGNFTRFINHSKKPNLSLQSIYWRGIPRVVFIALRNIAEGEQLTFDYGASFWKECGELPREL